jgi:hypothetical protein
LQPKRFRIFSISHLERINCGDLRVSLLSSRHHPSIMPVKAKFEYNGAYRQVGIDKLTFNVLKADLKYFFRLPDDFDFGIEVLDEKGDWLRMCAFFSVLFLFNGPLIIFLCVL